MFCFVFSFCFALRRSGDADYNKCLDKVAWTFQHDFGAKKLPLCPDPANAVALSAQLQVSKRQAKMTPTYSGEY